MTPQATVPYPHTCLAPSRFPADHLPVYTLPIELIIEVLRHCIGSPVIRTQKFIQQPNIWRPRFPPRIKKLRNILESSEWHLKEFDTLLTRVPKRFTTPIALTTTHLAVLGASHSALERFSYDVDDYSEEYYDLPNPLDPLIRLEDWTPCMRTPNSPLRGLERIHLDFKAPSLIALFCVQLPMFGAEFEGWSCLPSVTNIIGDADILGGTQELVLDFGGRYLDSDIVTKDHRDYGISLWNRPDMTWCKSDQVCILGEVVDRILSFAWMLDSGYIRHIRKIRIQGPVQEWVRNKWERIFATGGDDPDFDISRSTWSSTKNQDQAQQSNDNAGANANVNAEDLDEAEFLLQRQAELSPPFCGERCQPKCSDLVNAKYLADWPEVKDLPSSPRGSWCEGGDDEDTGLENVEW